MISVCLATYNGERYLEEQLNSILIQLDICDELIISDDGSSDSTIEIIKSYNDPRIRLIFNEGDHGYTNNFENALKESKGEYIFLSDQDDVWYDSKIKIMSKYLKKYTLVISNALYTDENLDPIGYTLFDLRGSHNGLLSNLFRSSALGATMAFRREIFTRLFPFPGQSKLCPHDLWILCISEAYYSVFRLPEVLIKYRRHADTTSNGGKKSNSNLKFKITFRLYCLWNILLRIK